MKERKRKKNVRSFIHLLQEITLNLNINTKWVEDPKGYNYKHTFNKVQETPKETPKSESQSKHKLKTGYVYKGEIKTQRQMDEINRKKDESRLMKDAKKAQRLRKSNRTGEKVKV